MTDLKQYECHWHREIEPVENAYQECMECMHVFQTEEELVTAYKELMKDEPFAVVKTGSQIEFCPLCKHDW